MTNSETLIQRLIPGEVVENFAWSTQFVEIADPQNWQTKTLAWHDQLWSVHEVGFQSSLPDRVAGVNNHLEPYTELIFPISGIARMRITNDNITTPHPMAGSLTPEQIQGSEFALVFDSAGELALKVVADFDGHRDSILVPPTITPAGASHQTAYSSEFPFTCFVLKLDQKSVEQDNT